jgi:hypothetical protein
VSKPSHPDAEPGPGQPPFMVVYPSEPSDIVEFEDAPPEAAQLPAGGQRRFEVKWSHKYGWVLVPSKDQPPPEASTKPPATGPARPDAGLPEGPPDKPDAGLPETPAPKRGPGR